MENKGAKIAVVIFLILAAIAFTFGTVMATAITQKPVDATAQQQAGQAIATVVLFIPFILAYSVFVLLNTVDFFISVHLIRNGSKGMGTTTLLICLGLLAAAAYFVAKVFGVL